MDKKEDIFGWVFVAKGIAITLVVIGHYLPNNSPEYWRNIRDVIYSFHMPLFFLLSGFLYVHRKYTYLQLVKVKTRRLLYPFISIALIFFLVKYPAGVIFDLEYQITPESVYALIINPLNSYKPLLWFVHALFFIFIIYPLVRNFADNNIIIFIFFALFYVFSEREIPIVGNGLENIPYFIAGTMLRESSFWRKKIITGRWMYIFGSLAMFSAAYLIWIDLKTTGQLSWLLRFSRLIVGLTGAVLVINISLLMGLKRKAGNEKRLLIEIGYYSMMIYLFHTFFQSMIRIGIYQLIGLPVYFEIVAFLAVISGIFFPLLIEKKLLRKNRITRKYILGLA